MIHYEIEQGSPEWLALRAGKITGSRVGDALRKNKDGSFSASRKDYAFDVALERITGESQSPDLSNVKAVQDGKTREPEARDLYSFMTGNDVQQVAFATHDAMSFFGASPDGLIGDDGVLEIKAPTAKKHLQYILGGTVPAEYLYQVMAELSCTGRVWCDFVSYHPSFPAESRIFIKRYVRDEKRMMELEKAVEVFELEVQAIVKQILDAGK
jgi:putative phage-type endonuclease